MKLALGFAVPCFLAAQTWTLQPSNTTASLRGVFALNRNVVWASGTGGTYLRTIDGGNTWMAGRVEGANDLDFRAVWATDENTAYLLSIGTGSKSRIYKTRDGGAHWALNLTNPDEKGFLDGLAFWDAKHAIVLGDPVDGQFVVLTTDDGGDHWERRATPPAQPGEGAFAASNTSLAVAGTSEVWFGTGGAQGARIFHSRDGGRTWSVHGTPVRHDGASAGIFGLAFLDPSHGMVVGGDYAKPPESTGNFALTADGGETWTVPGEGHPAGFRSAAAYVPERKAWIVTGTSGSDVSTDGGKSWKTFDPGNFNAMSFVPDGVGWAVGPRGRIAVFSWK